MKEVVGCASYMPHYAVVQKYKKNYESTNCIHRRCSNQFGSGMAILGSGNNHTHFCIFTSSSAP